MAYLDHYVQIRNDAMLKKHRENRQIIKGDKRKHVVRSVMDTLRDWRSTPFENEGASRHGLRSALCMDGHRWPLADLEAGKIVAEAFRCIGAKRPTWEEGQPQYLEPRENCNGCGKALPEEMLGSAAVMYCSEQCVLATREKRDFQRRNSADKSYAAAYRALKKTRNPPAACKQCERVFRPGTGDQIFCSNECRAKGHRKIFPRPCGQCGKTFQAAYSGAKFCSMKCKGVAASNRRYTHRCEFCSCTFTNASRLAKHCSSACQQAIHKLKLGHFPKRMKPHVFDFYFITLPASHMLTPEVLDGWFQRAA